MIVGTYTKKGRIMDAAYDLPQLQVVLEGFRNLPLSQWNQGIGEIRPADKGECGACVGAWIACFLDLPLRVRENTPAHWYYLHGANTLSDLLKLDPFELDSLLHTLGAPDDPFGADVWDHPPYEILCDTVKTVTGYDHNEYLKSLVMPVPERAPEPVGIPVPLSEFAREPIAVR